MILILTNNIMEIVSDYLERKILIRKLIITKESDYKL